MDKLKFETPDMVPGNIEKIVALFPSAITEMRGEDRQIKKGVNFEVLKHLLSPHVPRSVVEYMAKQQPLRAVFRDSVFASDDAKINVTEIFKNLSPDTKVKVIYNEPN